MKDVDQLKSKTRDGNLSVDKPKKWQRTNPMLVHGPGPDGKRCRQCKHLGYVQYIKRYYKCTLGSVSNCVTTDHPVDWPACAKFEEKGQDS